MNENVSFEKWYGTTIVSVRKKNEVVIAGDGQVTLGDAVMKSNAKKVRSLASGKGNYRFCWCNCGCFHFV